MTAFKRINQLINLVNIAIASADQAFIGNAKRMLQSYHSRGKNATKAHPKPHAHMTLVRAARTKHNKGK